MAGTILHGFIILQDVSSPTGSRLFGGSQIQTWATQVNLSTRQELDVPFKTGQEPEFVSADNTNIGSMWNRRKSYITSTGVDNFQINLSVSWSVDQVGSAMENFGAGSAIRMTPYVLWRMAASGHTFHLRGGTVIQHLINGQANDIMGGNQVGSLYTGSGIPVVIADLSFNDVATSQDYVSCEVSLVENKDLTFKTN